MRIKIQSLKYQYFYLYFGILFVLGLLSFLFYEKNNPLPATTIFDLVILISILVTRPVFKSSDILYLFIFFFGYVLMSSLYSVVYNGDHILDFLLAYKAYFYLVVLTFFCNKSVFTREQIVIIFRLLLFLFAFKYTISISFELNGRPWVYRENNFELMFLALVLLLKHSLTGFVKTTEWVVIALVFILSGSKSALPIFVIVSGSIIFKVITLKTLILGSLTIGTAGAAFIVVMLQKISQTGISGIDRIVFFRVFWQEMINSSIFVVLLGHNRLTPLLPSSCNSLQFYQGLFSFQNNGACYTPVLHTFLFRNIFDHGILGTACIIWATHYLLVKSGYSAKVAVTFNIVMILNGLSVSGYNSGFFPLAMILFLGAWRNNFSK